MGTSNLPQTLTAAHHYPTFAICHSPYTYPSQYTYPSPDTRQSARRLGLRGSYDPP